MHGHKSISFRKIYELYFLALCLIINEVRNQLPFNIATIRRIKKEKELKALKKDSGKKK